MTQMTCSNQTKELELAREHFDQFLALHELQEHTRISQDTLTGDYHFSQFSLHLIPVDSVEITDATIKDVIASGNEQGCSNGLCHINWSNCKDYF